MRTNRLRMARLLVAPIALLAALGTAPAAESVRGHLVELRAGPSVGRTLVRPEPVIGPRRAATINVAYTGFSRAAKRAFQRAVKIWAARINSPVPIAIDATFKPLGPGLLGQAGPSTFVRNFTGAPRPNTFFPIAIANKLAGVDFLPGQPDIVAEFSSTFSFHFGKDPAPATKHDFTTVVLHELGHGLGFVGGARVANENGTGPGFIRFNSASNPTLGPFIYSRFIENNQGPSILSFAEGSAALGNQLRGNKLFFDSRRVRRANGGQPAKIFAPNPFQGGSSYSHLNENTFPQGNPHSLMTPFLGRGETIRNPGGITQGILRDSGW